MRESCEVAGGTSSCATGGTKAAEPARPTESEERSSASEGRRLNGYHFLPKRTHSKTTKQHTEANGEKKCAKAMAVLLLAQTLTQHSDDAAPNIDHSEQ